PDEENAENPVLLSTGRMKQRNINSQGCYDQLAFVNPGLEKGPFVKAAENENVVRKVYLSLKLLAVGWWEAVELERCRVFGLAASLFEQDPLSGRVMGDWVLEVRLHA